MKAVAVFLSGLAAMLAGAFFRSCAEGVPAAFAQSWCGNAPPPGFVAATHAHCAWCALVAIGLVLVAVAPLFASSTGQRARAQVRW